MTREPQMLHVAIAGGVLAVARWPGAEDAPVVLAAHGITATHRSWSLIAEHLDGDVTLLAPDLRGRGASRALGGPYGIAHHADDCVAILDDLGLERAAFAGHSMGAFVVAVAAVRHPERVSSVLLVDGGVRLAAPAPDTDIDALLGSLIGPSIDRLKMTFPSREAYRDFWRAHPSFAGAWNEHVEAYVDYDLIGDRPPLRSGVSLEAVYADASDTVSDDLTVSAASRIAQPVAFVRATRDAIDRSPGFYRDSVAPRLRESVPHLQSDVVDANHFGLLLGEGAAAVAQWIRKLAVA